MTPRTPGRPTLCAILFMYAGFPMFAQISPCGSGQQLGDNAVITAGSPTYFSGSYVSAGNLSINIAGASTTGNANVTIQAGTAICLGPGFQAAFASGGGGFTAKIGSTPPAGSFAITTSSMPGATPGAYYQQQIAASGGFGSYNWFLNGGSLPAGLSLTSAGVVQGNPGASGTYGFVAEVQDGAGATASAVLSITVASAPVLSINGGSSSGETLATVTVPFAFGIYDSAGANDVSWAQFWIGNGSTSCYGDWGRPSLLDLYDGNTGATAGFNMDQADSFCTVSLASITNSQTDPTEVTVVLNLTFNPGFSGSYAVLEQVNYASGITGSWESVGALVIDPPPSINPQPTVTLTDNTQSSGYYVAGDSFTITVAGPPNQPVSLNLNGVGHGVQGYTNSGGVYSVNGFWTSSNVGRYAETWYVESVGAPALSFVVLAGAPSVTLTNLTLAGNTSFQVGNSYSFYVTGPPSSPVVLAYNQNGAAGTVNFGQTDSSGVLQYNGTWATSDIGAWTDIWSFSGVPVGQPITFTVAPVSCPVN